MLRMTSATCRAIAGRALRVAAFLCLLAPAAGASVTVAFLSGKAFVQAPGSPAWDPLRVGERVAPGATVRTARGGKAALGFDDGSRVVVDSGSTLVVREASGERSLVELALGSLRAFVAQIKTRRFEVKTPTAVCAVRGTEFQVDVNQEGRTAVQMFEGLLAVSDGRGNETLIKDRQSIQVTERGLGPVMGEPEQRLKQARQRQLIKRELGYAMERETRQSGVAFAMKNAVYQEGKTMIDVNGDRVRLEEYIIRPQPNQFELVVLDGRVSGITSFFYRGTFNTTLPNDLATALSELPGCIGGPCQYNLTGYVTGRSNGVDNMLEVASGGHQIDVNNDGYGSDIVTTAFNPQTDSYVSLNVPDSTGLLGINQHFYQTLFDNDTLTFDGVMHQSWTPQTGITPFNGAPGTGIQNMSSAQVAFNDVTSIVNPPSCSPPNCTYNENGVEHQVVYDSNLDGSVWDKYDSYIISDQGEVAPLTAFNNLTSGAAFNQTMLGWNFETIVTASEFQGRSIDLVVEPKIFIESGLIP